MNLLLADCVTNPHISLSLGEIRAFLVSVLVGIPASIILGLLLAILGYGAWRARRSSVALLTWVVIWFVIFAPIKLTIDDVRNSQQQCPSLPSSGAGQGVAISVVGGPKVDTDSLSNRAGLRDEKRLGARALGVGVELHYLFAPLDELVRRAAHRTASGEGRLHR